MREEGSDPLGTEREALGVDLQHRLPDGSSKFLLALESLGMAIGTPARHDIGRQIGADTAQGCLRVRDSERNLAERREEDIAVYQSLDPPSDGGVIVAIAGSARSFRGWDQTSPEPPGSPAKLMISACWRRDLGSTPNCGDQWLWSDLPFHQKCGRASIMWRGL